MNARSEIVVNPENQWRLQTPGARGWKGSAQPNSPNKYFIISVDNHLGPPPTLFRDRIDEKYRDRVPKVEKKDGRKYLVLEGRRPMLLLDDELAGEDMIRAKAGSGNTSVLLGGGSTVLEREAHQDLDGVDGEVLFPNGPGLLMWSTPDPLFCQAQCRIWNNWAWEVCEPHKARCNPAAAIAPADLEGSIAEVQRAAKMGYRVVQLPCKPIFGASDPSHVNYNQKHFDPLWAAIQDTDLTMAFHVSSGSDPRVARGEGGSIINYVVHSLAPTIEPVVNLCASGVLERFPKLRFATIEANAGWLPWLLDSMDEGYRKHHMWVAPKLKALPSDYYRAHGAASFCDDRSAMLLVEPYNLDNNLMFANDYPHHEGSWPHSAPMIERLMGHLREDVRRRVLGLNAARFFRFDIPEHYRKAGVISIEAPTP
jgi:predicted TIM-barrel fold metal-dependent hydrolase